MNLRAFLIAFMPVFQKMESEQLRPYRVRVATEELQNYVAAATVLSIARQNRQFRKLQIPVFLRRKRPELLAVYLHKFTTWLVE